MNYRSKKQQFESKQRQSRNAIEFDLDQNQAFFLGRNHTFADKARRAKKGQNLRLLGIFKHVNEDLKQLYMGR